MTMLQIRIEQSGETEWQVLIPGEPAAVFASKDAAFRSAYVRCKIEGRAGRLVTVHYPSEARAIRMRPSGPATTVAKLHELCSHTPAKLSVAEEAGLPCSSLTSTR